MKQNDDMLGEYDFSKGKRGSVLPQTGKTRITIFLDNEVLQWFKAEAERECLGYQTVINQALHRYIRQDRRPIQDVLREVVREELGKVRKAG
jgi:uncharacterized protein (DUF4415 family)